MSNAAQKVTSLIRSAGRQLLGSLLAAGLMSQAAHAQISKANQILLNRGLQLQNMVEYDDIFSLTAFSNDNYTSVNWLDTDYQPLLGPAPGFLWGRWVSDSTDMPPRQQQTFEGFSDETPYMSQLVDLELSDEPDLDDGTVWTNEINWFLSTETNFPNTILYINYGGQASDATLATMITAGKPRQTLSIGLTGQGGAHGVSGAAARGGVRERVKIRMAKCRLRP